MKHILSVCRQAFLYRGCLLLGSQVTGSWDPSVATVIRRLKGLPHHAWPGIRGTSPERAARGATGCSTRRPSGHRETGSGLTSTPGGHARHTMKRALHVQLPSMRSLLMPPQVEARPKILQSRYKGRMES